MCAVRKMLKIWHHLVYHLSPRPLTVACFPDLSRGQKNAERPNPYENAFVNKTLGALRDWKRHGLPYSPL